MLFLHNLKVRREREKKVRKENTNDCVFYHFLNGDPVTKRIGLTCKSEDILCVVSFGFIFIYVKHW